MCHVSFNLLCDIRSDRWPGPLMCKGHVRYHMPQNGSGGETAHAAEVVAVRRSNDASAAQWPIMAWVFLV